MGDDEFILDGRSEADDVNALIPSFSADFEREPGLEQASLAHSPCKPVSR